MPGWINTDAEEDAWQEAKEKYKENDGVSNDEDKWTDKDWATVTNITKNILGRESRKLSNILKNKLEEDF